MTGTLSGSVDHVTNTANANTNNQEFFTNLYRFFNGPLRSGSYVDLIALQTGSSGTGTNFHDEGNPFGQNAFSVWRIKSASLGEISTRRQVDYYICFQWADTAAFGSSPGSPGTLNAGTADGVGMAIAWREDGLSPWGGTTLANGNDNKGAVVWNAGSSSLFVFPRSNGLGGSHVTNKQNMSLLADLATGATNYRYHFLVDRDSFISLTDSGDDISYNFVYIHGTYEPLPGFTTGSGGVCPMPMFQMAATVTANIFSVATTYGGIAGSSTTANGGIVGPRMTSGSVSRDFRIDRYSNDILSLTTLQPNPQFTLSRYDEFRIPIIMYEANFGFLGYIDFVTDIFNASVHDVTSGSLKAVFGCAGANVNIVVPWSGAAPGSFSDRSGRQF